MTSRVTRDEWIDTAFDVLAKKGDSGLRVDELCSALGVTKGSFYWHFTDRAELVAEICSRWANGHADTLVELALETTADPLERLRRLHDRGKEKAGSDRAMRMWAGRDERIAAAVRAADRRIFGYMAKAFSDLGFPPAEAELRAKLLLYTAVGSYSVDSGIAPNAGPDQFERELRILARPLPPGER
ncbi:TetR/AcrR family transcriptional regulator [Actinomadura rugatobispora]|uniref:TetR/AcrR family transcriptional regulator n=1 Tax=Actinomadura rugatobispora TaxID=1994 RepID=A0ABW1A396_9ACTN|nr:TetR/AcrR family transcriptional regulator [Actinomadura rugatobispora]